MSEADEVALADDLADVLSRVVVGWHPILGADLAEHPDVVRVMKRYREARRGGVVTGLMDTTDAMVWASEFCRIFDGRMVTADETEPEECVTVGGMVGWFANAIELGRTTGRQEVCPHPDFHFVSEEMRICTTCGLAIYDEEDCGEPDPRPGHPARD